jgi:hypothetical protein
LGESWQFLKNYSSIAYFWSVFFPQKVQVVLTKYGRGPHFGRFFLQIHLVTLKLLPGRARIS